MKTKFSKAKNHKRAGKVVFFPRNPLRIDCSNYLFEPILNLKTKHQNKP
jgi:hypothetical protein